MTATRQPRFTRFMVTGGVVGVLLGLVTSLLTEPAEGYGTLAGAGYLALAGLFIGVVLGAAVAAVLVGRQPRAPRPGRRSRT